MRPFIILLIIVYFTLTVHGRPSQNEGDRRSSEVELEYEDEPEEKDSQQKPEIEDSLGEEQNHRYMEMNKNSYPSRSVIKDRSNAEFSDFKHPKNKEEREINANDESNVFEGFQFYPKRHQTARYLPSNDAPDQLDTPRVNNRNVNSFKANHNSILTDDTLNKRTAQEQKRPLSEESDMLFEKEQTDKNDLNNEPLNANHHSSKQCYGVMQQENRGLADSKSSDNERLYYSRDRRNVDSNEPNSDNISVEDQDQNENADPSDEEDGEAAIKKHIQKLSSDELQDLLNSLSEEKRNLLKNIIDDYNLTENDAVHKREITKKAEAVEDNSYNEDSKIQSGSVSVTDSSISISTDSPGAINKLPDSSKLESSDTTTTISDSLEMESKSVYQFQDPSVQQKSDEAISSASNVGSNEKSEIVSNEAVTLKSANKREVKVKDLQDMSNVDQSYSCPHDEESQILDDDEQLQFDQDSKNFKRDVDQQAELDSKMKSLEDSFPNSDIYDESPGPLVRVKRKNTDAILKKRSAALLPDAKVAFFSYRSESDEDDEEGNEFDDEGFYERAHVCNKNIDDESSAEKTYGTGHLNLKRQGQVSEFNKDKNSKLGTDTDSVLSGVNEVDENLMFNSGSRYRRTTKDNHLSHNEDLNVQSFNLKSTDDEIKVMSESNVNNAPNYQESDAFGGLPHGYDGDLGRYKRIRRVKQSHAEEPASDTL